ncbi:peroxisomal carnitine O-octanoyltransferase-like isoform X2 [Apostichopus japonicus]|uniref:peroxisomal carnitine O-octanoyltransferase-like isoform X2 n=1 Tax=Stichopus japonicus TaxID=307972 RepID=UPI003AB537D2
MLHAIPGEKTFQYEESLPSLPLPPLEQTLTKYLESVKPFITVEEYQETEKIVDEFSKDVGKELQQKLEAKAKSSKNWLEEWWEDLAYLRNRAPIAVLGSMVGSAPSTTHLWAPREGTQLLRTAKSTWTVTKYFDIIRKEKLPVMRSGKGDKVFSMHQYRFFFSTSRVPGEPKDGVARYFKTVSEGPCPNHMVVFCNGHIFKMEMFDENEEQFGSYEILRQLTYIKENSAKSGQGIGVLTADDRTSWAQTYEHLLCLDPINQNHLETIQSAIIAVSLDNENPKNLSELFLADLSGINCQDRWFDKSFNTIYFESGAIGFVGDHCPYEGIIGTIFNTWADEIIARTTTDWMGKPDVRTDGAVPQELIFVIDEKVKQAQIHAKDTYVKLAAKCDVYCSCFPLYGRVWVKNSGFHPDGWMQLAIQLTYFTKHSKLGPCYETATTRQFYHGRTATIRTCSSEVADWCKAMNDPAATNGDKLDLMRAAVTTHMVLGSQAMEGQGCDRHLLGLYAVSEEEGYDLPEIFTDPSFTKSFALSIFSYKTCPETNSNTFFEEMFKSLVRMQNVVTECKL